MDTITEERNECVVQKLTLAADVRVLPYIIKEIQSYLNDLLGQTVGAVKLLNTCEPKPFKVLSVDILRLLSRKRV